MLLLQSCPSLCNPLDCSPPGSSVRGILQEQEYWSGLPFPSPGDLSDPGIKPGSPALQAWAPREAHCTDYLSLIFILLIMTDSACLYLQRHRDHNSLNHRNGSSSFYHSGWCMVEGSIFVEIKIKLKLN